MSYSLFEVILSQAYSLHLAKIYPVILIYDVRADEPKAAIFIYINVYYVPCNAVFVLKSLQMVIYNSFLFVTVQKQSHKIT